MCISVDITLGFEEEGWDAYPGIDDGFIYRRKSAANPRTEEDAWAQHDWRVSRATSIPGAVSADATDLPFADNTMDTVVDSRGPAFYFSGAKRAKYMAEIDRVSKPGAKLFIDPVTLVDL